MFDADHILKRMTLRQKVGQVLMLAFEPDHLEQTLSTFAPGCLMLWGESLGSTAALANLTNRAQQVSLNERGLPLWMHGIAAELGWNAKWQ